MNKDAIIFLSLTLFCIAIEAFFSMFEIAAISFNKVRLTYLTSKKMKKAVQLDYLLKKPSRLFGTTLLLVNTALQIGSESSRRFYESIGVNPVLAPLTQVVLVVILGELAPLFAARRYPERISLFCVSVVYYISKWLSPFIWLIEKISYLANYLIKNKESQQFYLTKEEIQKAFEEKDSVTKDIDINQTVSNIFSLKDVMPNEIMAPLTSTVMIPSDFTYKELNDLIEPSPPPFMLIYHHEMNNIISVALIRDLLRASPTDLVRNYAKSPWFVTEDISVLDILKQFRKNKQYVVIILDDLGKPKGIITLDMIIYQIFGSMPSAKDVNSTNIKTNKREIFIEKTLSGEILVKDFNKKFHANFDEKHTTLSDLIYSSLQHHPSVGEIIYIESFEFIVKEVSLLHTKKVLVRNLK